MSHAESSADRARPTPFPDRSESRADAVGTNSGETLCRRIGVGTGATVTFLAGLASAAAPGKSRGVRCITHGSAALPPARTGAAGANVALRGAALGGVLPVTPGAGEASAAGLKKAPAPETASQCSAASAAAAVPPLQSHGLNKRTNMKLVSR